MRIKPLLIAVTLSFAMDMPVHAHHSFAMFDFNNTLTFTATVKEFRWTNPHVVLLVEGSPHSGTPARLGLFP